MLKGKIWIWIYNEGNEAHWLNVDMISITPVLNGTLRYYVIYEDYDKNLQLYTTSNLANIKLN